MKAYGVIPLLTPLKSRWTFPLNKFWTEWTTFLSADLWPLDRLSSKPIFSCLTILTSRGISWLSSYSVGFSSREQRPGIIDLTICESKKLSYFFLFIYYSRTAKYIYYLRGKYETVKPVNTYIYRIVKYHRKGKCYLHRKFSKRNQFQGVAWSCPGERETNV